MAKNKSKRVSERKKTKNLQKHSRNEAKIRKEQRKKQKSTVKVPKHVIMTEAEKEHLKSIKLATQARSKESKDAKPNENSYITELGSCIDKRNFDTFIEIIDYRDIEGTRNISAEKFLEKSNKKYHFFINYNNGLLNVDLGFLNTEHSSILDDFSILKDSKKICIFGCPKIGKFLLSKTIENFFNNEKKIEFEFIKTPSNRPTICEIFCGNISLKNIIPALMFEKVWEFLDKEDLKKFYMTSSFTDYEVFLSLLADKVESKSTTKKDLNKGALLFFKDILEYKIAWFRSQNSFYFKFIHQ